MKYIIKFLILNLLIYNFGNNNLLEESIVMDNNINPQNLDNITIEPINNDDKKIENNGCNFTKFQWIQYGFSKENMKNLFTKPYIYINYFLWSYLIVRLIIYIFFINSIKKISIKFFRIFILFFFNFDMNISYILMDKIYYLPQFIRNNCKNYSNDLRNNHNSHNNSHNNSNDSGNTEEIKLIILIFILIVIIQAIWILLIILLLKLILKKQNKKITNGVLIFNGILLCIYFFIPVNGHWIYLSIKDVKLQTKKIN